MNEHVCMSLNFELNLHIQNVFNVKMKTCYLLMLFDWHFISLLQASFGVALREEQHFSSRNFSFTYPLHVMIHVRLCLWSLSELFAYNSC